MVALLFLLVVLPCILVIGAIVIGTVILTDTFYDIGVSLYNNKKPVNKYRSN